MECPNRDVQQTAGNVKRQEGFCFRIGALSDNDECYLAILKIPKKHLLYTSLTVLTWTLSREG